MTAVSCLRFPQIRHQQPHLAEGEAHVVLPLTAGVEAVVQVAVVADPAVQPVHGRAVSQAGTVEARQVHLQVGTEDERGVVGRQQREVRLLHGLQDLRGCQFFSSFSLPVSAIWGFVFWVQVHLNPTFDASDASSDTYLFVSQSVAISAPAAASAWPY